MSLRRAPFVPRPRPRPKKSGGNGDAEKLARVDTISKNARGIWFGLLGALVFAGVTLLGIEDIDFFGVDRSTKLPLIGVSVPVTYFFSAGATLVTAFYVYFHLYLVQLWQALGDAPARPNNQPLGHTVHPWLVTDAMIRWRNSMRRDDSAETRPLAIIGIIVTFTLVWLFGLLILGYFWWRSMPAHNEKLTLGLCVLLLFAGYIALSSFRAARWYLSDQTGNQNRWRWVLRPVIGLVVFVTFALSWIRTEGGFEGYFHDTAFTTEAIEDFSPYLRLSRADLSGAYLTILPSDWRPRDHAEKWFNADWCKREGLGSTCDGINGEQTTEQLEEWQSHRQTYLDTLSRPNLKGRDLRRARMINAFLPNVDLSEARMEWANLTGAQMERTVLFVAQMQGANLEKARMEGTDLSLAQMVAADLSEAQMQGANLNAARMPLAILSQAQLQGANLSETSMERAVLFEAQMEGADLNQAWMEGASLHGAQLDGANLSNTNLKGVDLREARMEGANFNGALMEGALIAGKAGSPILLKSASFTKTITLLLAVKDVNFTGAEIQRKQITHMFGDASTTLPAEMPLPCHWPNQILQTGHKVVTLFPYESSFFVPLPDDPFIGRWRGWVEANGGTWPTSTRFNDLKDVIAIPPPPECPLIKDM